MDIVKIRELSDTELENALREAKQDLWQSPLRAVDTPAEGLQHDPADATNDRADPDRPARAQARPDGVREITR